MIYRVVVYGPCGRAGWTLCGCYADLADAELAALEFRRECLLAAVVAVGVTATGQARLRVLDANIRRPQRLEHAPEFRRVALAL